MAEIKESFIIRGIEFNNRVLTASGTFGYGDEVKTLTDVNRLGGIITKSLSLKPRAGNPPVRIVETAGGMLNSIGLANIGVDKFIGEKLPYLRTLSTRIIVNVAASSVEEYCSVVQQIDEQGGISGFEINVSCPNVKEGGLNFGTDPKRVAEITREVRKRTQRPLLLKLTPNVTHISEFARAAESEGADAVSVINTLVGMAIDIKNKRPKLSTVTGGLSGPAIKPIALAKVYETSKAIKIPVIGIGGIQQWEDAIEFLLAGATAIQVGTMNFIDPAGGEMIVDGIKQFCVKEGLKDVGDLVGTLKVDTSTSVIDSWR